MDPNTTTETLDILKPALVAVIDEMRGMYSAGKQIAVEQAPVLAQEIVKLEIAKSVLWFALGVALIAGAVWCIRKLNAHKEVEGFPYVVCFLVGVTGLIMSVSNLVDFVGVLAAPRLFIIKEASSILKGLH